MIRWQRYTTWPSRRNISICADDEKTLKMSPKKTKQSAALLSNHELVVIAAFLVGAQRSSADTEDIAVKASDLAPGRFTWRKYKEQINIDAVRKRLWDATKEEKGAYLIGSERDGWRLTKAGYDFAREHMGADVLAQPKKGRASQVERTAQTRELKRMMAEPVFTKITTEGAATATKSDAERFFRIDDYVTGKARAAKIERFRIIASSKKELLNVIDILAALVKER
jgi:hypothetical protein